MNFIGLKISNEKVSKTPLTFIFGLSSVWLVTAWTRGILGKFSIFGQILKNKAFFPNVPKNYLVFFLNFKKRPFGRDLPSLPWSLAYALYKPPKSDIPPAIIRFCILLCLPLNNSNVVFWRNVPLVFLLLNVPWR